jgi:hypothetical protein
MMQATEDGVGDHLAIRLWLNWLVKGARDALLHALVWPGVIEVGLILLHYPAEMALAQNEEEVQAFAPYTTQESLTNGVYFGRLIGRD